MAQNVVYWKFEDGTLDIRGDEVEILNYLLLN